MIDSVLPIIIDSYDDFTKVEKIIADYFISNKEFDDFSIEAVKERLYVSKASLSRFAQKLGFRGYREFIYQYQQMFSDKSLKISSHLDVINTYNDILIKFDKLVDFEQINRICQFICKVEKILVIGVGSSGLVAEETKRRFIRLGIIIDSCDYEDLMKIQSIFENEKNLVIGLSISGKTNAVLFSLRQAHIRNAKTVLITCFNDTKDYIDEYVVIPGYKNLDAGNIISPQFPLLVYIDLLYNCFINLNHKNIKLHEETLYAIGRK